VADATRNYTILCELGRGGMGVVYLAEQLSLQRRVAIKVLRSDGCVDTRGIRRFHREARAVQKLNHPNIVRLLDHDLECSEPYLVLEYVEGGKTLADLVEGGALPAMDDRIVLMHEIASGLAHIHAADLLHRDLKPRNILLAPEGTPRIIDLGLARDVSVDETRLTADGEGLGTVTYMPPEQFMGLPADKRSDVYALGLIMYELAAGRTIFGARAVQGISPVDRMRHGVPAVVTASPGLVPRLAELIDSCLGRDADRRPADGVAVEAALGSLLDDLAAEDLAAGRPARTRAERVPIAPGWHGAGPGPPVAAAGAARTAMAAGGAIAVAIAVAIAFAGLVWPGWRSAPTPARASAVSLEASGSRLVIRFATDRPVRARLLAARRDGEPAIACLAEEPGPVQEHILEIARPDWADCGAPRVTLAGADAAAEELPFAAFAERLAGHYLLQLERFIRMAERTATAARRPGRGAELASLEELGPNRMAFPAIRASAPWIRRIVLDPGLLPDVRARVASALSRAQLLDHLCPARLASGRGEVRAFHPHGYGPNLVANDAPVLRRLRELAASSRRSLHSTVAIGDRRFDIHRVGGPHGDGLEVGGAGMVLMGYDPEHPLDDLVAGRQTTRPRLRATTGEFSLPIPPEMVGTGRRLILVMGRSCEHADHVFQAVEVGRIHLMNDGACASTGKKHITGMAAVRALPPGLVGPGALRIEVHLAPPAWSPETRGFWFGGLQIYSVAPSAGVIDPALPMMHDETTSR
jgi:hypothetical protein